MPEERRSQLFIVAALIVGLVVGAAIGSLGFPKTVTSTTTEVRTSTVTETETTTETTTETVTTTATTTEVRLKGFVVEFRDMFGNPVFSMGMEGSAAVLGSPSENIKVYFTDDYKRVVVEASFPLTLLVGQTNVVLVEAKVYRGTSVVAEGSKLTSTVNATSIDIPLTWTDTPSADIDKVVLKYTPAS